jgi:hypothetical protein
MVKQGGDVKSGMCKVVVVVMAEGRDVSELCRNFFLARGHGVG